MAKKTDPGDLDDQPVSRPIIIEMRKDSTTPVGEAAAMVYRFAGSLRQATQSAVTSPGRAVQDSTNQLVESTTQLSRKAAKAAIKSYLARQEKVNKSHLSSTIETKSQRAVQGTKNTLTQVRKAVDPRIVAGGLAGLTAGEIVGGAVGGVAGAVVAGPAGAVVGAQVGGFTAGMLGLKLGADAVYDHLAANRTSKATVITKTATESSRNTSIGRFLQIKTGERLGEIVGLTSGASIGLVIAGPAGGLVGAVIGEALGAHLGEDLNKPKTDKQGRKKPGESVDQWLNRFGKNTAGEAVSVLVAGSVGSLFGPSGRLIGHRVGLIVGKRVAWHELEIEDNQEPSPSQEQSIALFPSQDKKPHSLEKHRRVAFEQSDPNQSHLEKQDVLPISSSLEDQTLSIRAEPPIQFTQRQLEVLALMSQQLDTREIAEQLDITPSTVNYHRRNIYKKIKVSSNPESLYVALELTPVTLAD